RSTYTLCGIGGLDGRQLQEGDTLPIGNEAKVDVQIGQAIDASLIPTYGKSHEIRVIMGLCSYRLTEESKQKFFDLEWQVTPEANIVGYHFKVERLNFVETEQPFDAGSIPFIVVDLGYPIGSIKVPDGVDTIALLNDAVTGGGYVTIATIISTDLNKMGQIKSGEKVKFVSVDIDEALAARKEETDKLNQVRKQFQ